MVVGVGDEQETSMMVERQASRIVEHAIGIAMLLGADRELDSRITNKSIVFHLFQFQLTTTKGCSKLRRDEDRKEAHSRDTRITPAQRSNRSNEPIDDGTAEQHCKHSINSTADRYKERERDISRCGSRKCVVGSGAGVWVMLV